MLDGWGVGGGVVAAGVRGGEASGASKELEVAAGKKGGPEVGAAETVDAWKGVAPLSRVWGVGTVTDGMGATTGNGEGEGVGGPKELG